MAGNVSVSTPPTGTPEQVAFELLKFINSYDTSRQADWTKEAILDTYGECLLATHGHRKVK